MSGLPLIIGLGVAAYGVMRLQSMDADPLSNEATKQTGQNFNSARFADAAWRNSNPDWREHVDRVEVHNDAYGIPVYWHYLNNNKIVKSYLPPGNEHESRGV